MAMTLRADKGAILSWNEMDANFRACMGVHNLLHLQDQKDSGVNGGTFTAGAWRTRDLNTVAVNNIDGASLESNQITIPAGTYYLDGMTTGYRVSRHLARLFNATTFLTLLSSSTGNSVQTYGPSNLVRMTGVVTLTAVAVITLQHQCGVTGNDTGFGNAAGLGEKEIYSDIKIWKLS